NATKSKWAIRLPELLNTTVGPDRQKRDLSRRNTTAIVLQQEQQQKPSASALQHTNLNSLSQSFPAPEMSNNAADDRPSSPLVASLTCRGLTSNSGERPTQRPRPMLPVRLSTQTNSTRSESLDNNHNMGTNNDRHQKGKTSAPINYSKHFYPSRSTTTVVKDIIGGGATLVYDSQTPDKTLHTLTSSTPTAALLQNDYYPNHQYQQQRKEHVRIEQTKQSLKTNLINKDNTNKNLLTLTGRQLQSKSPYNTKSINTKTQNHIANSDDDETKDQQYLISAKDSLNRSTSMSDNFSISAKSLQQISNGTSLDSNLHLSTNCSTTPIVRKSVLARAELWDRRISTNENETNTILSPYDIEQWSTEFEKIQNLN
ncbi:unnamed protein product, partial [Rotaria sp. Silwood1]